MSIHEHKTRNWWWQEEAQMQAAAQHAQIWSQAAAAMDGLHASSCEAAAADQASASQVRACLSLNAEGM